MIERCFVFLMIEKRQMMVGNADRPGVFDAAIPAYFSGLLFICGFFSYLPILNKNLIYILSIGCLAALIISRLLTGEQIQLPKARVFILLFLGILGFLFSTLSIARSGESLLIDVLQIVFYPLIGTLLLIFLYDASNRYPKLLGWLVFFVCLLNGLVASCNILFGPLTLPMYGKLVLYRNIFFLPFQSSSGLLGNINYYSVVQGVGFWVAFGLLHNHLTRKKLTNSGFIFIFVSSFFGASRSAGAALLCSLMLYFYITADRIKKIRIIIYTMISIIIVLVIVRQFFTVDRVDQAFRLYKGFNARDEIWAAAVEMFYERPLVGWGSIATINESLVDEFGSPNTSTQNTLFFSLLRIGILGTVCWLLQVLMACYYGFRRSSTRFQHTWALCGIFFVGFDSMFRTYSFGGVGFIPLALAFFCSALLGCDRLPRRPAFG